MKFLMLAIRNKRVKEEMRKGAPRIVDFEYGINREDPVKFKLVVREDGDGTTRFFATNIQMEIGERMNYSGLLKVLGD